MKTIYFYFACLIVQFFSISISNAQTINLKLAPASIAIDGSVKEWGNNLNYTNDKAKISYTLSNDKNNLYLVVKTKDIRQQRNIIGSGITLNIDTKGRKKHSAMVTFPIINKDDGTELMSMDTVQIKKELELTKYREIHTEGFINSDPDGIQAVMGYDNGYLVYEEAIPLKLFPTDDTANEWAFNIQINGLEKKQHILKIVVAVARETSTMTGSSSRPPTYTGTLDPSTLTADSNNSTSTETRIIHLTATTDFWGKFTLAK